MLSYDHYEGPQGRPLVILPGLFGVAENWQRLAKRFATLTTVYVLDLPFHGHSKEVLVSPDIPIYEGMARSVHAWTVSLGLSDIVVMGHSMGGKVAMMFSQMYPSLVSHMLVIDIAPIRYPPSHLRVFEGLRTADVTASTRTLLDAHLKLYIPDPMQRGFFLKQAVMQPEGGFVWAFNLEALYARYTEILAAPTLTVSEMAATLIAGEQSDYMTMASVAAFQGAFPNVQVVWLPTGHWVHVQDPDGVFGVVDRVFS